MCEADMKRLEALVEQWVREAGIFVLPSKRTTFGAVSTKNIEALCRIAMAHQREKDARLIEGLQQSHCNGTGGECTPDDLACDFVTAWGDAIYAIRHQDDPPPVPCAIP